MTLYSMLKTSPIYLVGTYPVVNRIVAKTKTYQNHLELENLFFIDRKTNTRIDPNDEPMYIDNDLLTGKLLIMVRTSDADCKSNNEVCDYQNHNNSGTSKFLGNAMNAKVSNYLRPHRKRFEIQLQMKFKKQPNPRQKIYLSCGYDKPVKLGKVQQASLQAALQFCKLRLPSFRYSLSGCKENACELDQRLGRYENPYFAFPIETSLDRIAVTKQGIKPPLLGTNVYEDPKDIAFRQNGGTIQFNTEDTYTLCLWNDYVDFVSWKAMNLPAVPKFSLAHVNNGQPMIVKIYSLKNENNEDGKHYKSNMETLIEVEVSRVGVTSLGDGAKEWIRKAHGSDYEKNSSNTSVAIGSNQEEEFDDRSVYGWVDSIFS